MSAAPSVPEKPFRLGLVVGKFAPLHAGHEWLIAQAASQCEALLILSYTQPEFDGCSVPTRRAWLAERAAGHEVHVIDNAWLAQRCVQLGIAPQLVPPNTADDLVQQHFLGWLLKNLLQRQPDALFCSENYGPPCAAVLSTLLGRPVQAVVVDQPRRHRPISASQLRADPGLHAAWLAPCVRAHFARRVLLLGGESSGKSTLAAALASDFATPWVAEYGRELWEAQGGVLQEPDMLAIAEEQLRRENAAWQDAQARADLATRTGGYPPLVFCDTSPLTTAYYSDWMFQRVAPQLAALTQRPYDAIILCVPDFAFVQDGTRCSSEFRDAQHAWYQTQLENVACPVLCVGGGVQARRAQVKQWLQQIGLVALA